MIEHRRRGIREAHFCLPCQVSTSLKREKLHDRNEYLEVQLDENGHRSRIPLRKPRGRSLTEKSFGSPDSYFGDAAVSTPCVATGWTAITSVGYRWVAAIALSAC